MVRFYVLGALDLQGKDGEELRSVLVQPKRLALLAYLVLAKPHRFHRRDSLMALLWPEAETDRARLALRQALHFLRRSLGDGVIVRRGDEEVGIAVEALWCDAIAFESALDRGHWAEALELYRGDLLAGFFATDVSPQVEQWLDQERARLRALAAAAGWALSSETERNGKLAASTEWARKALLLAPDDETGLRRLITLLASCGDRAAALREYDEFARRLKQEFHVEPAPETRALVDAIRSERDGWRTVSSNLTSSTDLPLVVGAAAEGSSSRPTTPDTAPTATLAAEPRSTSAPRLKKRLVVAGVVALLLALGILSLLRRSPDEAGPLLAVGSITNEAGASFDETARLLPGLLATDLARVERLAVVSQTRLVELMGQTSGGTEPAHALAEAARRAGAIELIEGALYRRGNDLRLDLRRVDLARGVLRRSYSASGRDAFELADRTTADIAHDFSLAAPATALSTTGPGSLVARRFYEEGLRAYYRGEWRAALRLFATALSEDSSFAMAAYYAALSVAPFRTDSAFILLMKATRLADRAPDRERLIIRFGGDHVGGHPGYFDYRVRAAVAESLALRFPNEPDGPLAMATMRVNSGDFVGALPYARRVIAMDSLSLLGKMPVCRACNAFGTLLTAYKGMGSDSFPAVERVAREWSRLQPKAAGAWLMLAGALSWRGRNDEALEALNKATQLQPSRSQFYEHPETVPAMLFESAVIQGENYSIAERLLRDRSRFDERDQEANWWLATTLRQQGRISELLPLAKQTKEFRVAEGRTPDPWEYVEAQLLFELGRFRESARKFEALMRAKPNDPSDPGYTSRYGVGAATAWAAAGDTQRLPALADSIERAARHSAYGLDWHLPHHVRGLLWQARGRPARAIEEFQAAIYSSTLGYTRTNLELGRTFLSLGRPHDAIRILREALGGSSDGPDYFLTRTDVHEWLARSFEVGGMRDSAVVHYRKVAEAWKKGDAPYRAQAEAARRKLDDLAR
jgi:DNA-binding SARP family transcriptional activator/TolB-like protein